jgi:acetyl-CoA carboxylase biotin carboxyl carrier protein
VKLLGKLAGRRPEPLRPDTAAIRALAGLLAETGLSEIEYAIGDHRIRVAREAANGKAAPVNGHASAAAPMSAPANGATSEPSVEVPANAASLPGTLASPMVGIAYLAAEPGAAPFVQVGDRVSKGQPLLIIEAMKVMNQIRAPHAGRVARIFIEDSAPVEYGAPLMLIE